MCSNIMKFFKKISCEQIRDLFGAKNAEEDNYYGFESNVKI